MSGTVGLQSSVGNQETSNTASSFAEMGCNPTQNIVVHMKTLKHKFSLYCNTIQYASTCLSLETHCALTSSWTLDRDLTLHRASTITGDKTTGSWSPSCDTKMSCVIADEYDFPISLWQGRPSRLPRLIDSSLTSDVDLSKVSQTEVFHVASGCLIIASIPPPPSLLLPPTD